jgi:hypothetical protein
MVALAAEHEKRVVAEAGLDRLRAELELMHEQLREAIHQAQAANERSEQVELDIVQLRRVSLRRWVWLSGIAAMLLLSGWLLRFSTEPARNGPNFIIATGRSLWDAAEEKIGLILPPASGPVTARTEATAIPRLPGPPVEAGQSHVLAARSGEAEPGPVHTVPPTANNSVPQQHSDNNSQAAPEPKEQQQPAVVSADARPNATPVQLEPPDAMARNEWADADQRTAQVAVEPRQPEPMPVEKMSTPPSGSTAAQPSPPSTAPVSVSANDTAQDANASTETVVANLSIHYEQSSSSAHADAGRVSALLVHAGFGTSQLLGAQHVPQEPVVRYFFAQDAKAAKSIAAILRKQNAKWQAEDCTHYGHKPPPGSIQVWPSRIR